MYAYSSRQRMSEQRKQLFFIYYRCVQLCTFKFVKIMRRNQLKHRSLIQLSSIHVIYCPEKRINSLWGVYSMRQKYFWGFSLNCKCISFVFVSKWILASDWFVLLVSVRCFYRKETELCYLYCKLDATTDKTVYRTFCLLLFMCHYKQPVSSVRNSITK